MSTRRITICIPEKTARRIKKAAGRRSVSSWVAEVIEDHLSDAELERQFEEWYASLAPSAEEVAAADAIFNAIAKPRRRRKGAA